MDVFYINAGRVQDTSKLQTAFEKMAPSSVHLTEYDRPFPQFYHISRTLHHRHQRGVSLYFCNDYKVREVVTSDKYDILGCIVQRDSQTFLHMVSYRTPYSENYAETRMFRKTAWEYEFVQELERVFLRLASYDYTVDATYISSDCNMNLNGKSSPGS